MMLTAGNSASRRVISLEYLGCYVDFAGGIRDLNGLMGLKNLDSYSKEEAVANYISFNLTRELCSAVCSSGGFPYMGLQDMIGCYCDFIFGSQGAAPESQCSKTCSGNTSQSCGGFDRNTVFGLTYRNDGFFGKSATKPTIVAGTSYGQKLYSVVTVRSFSQCVILCSVDCQALIFDQQSGGTDCYLLRFPLAPSNLTGVSGDFYALV